MEALLKFIKLIQLSFSRTWLLMNCQSVCRTFTTTFRNAFRPSSKVLLTSRIPRQTVNITDICYMLSGSFFFLSFRLFGTSGGCYGWSRKVHDESPLQGSVLSWDHRRWEERPGYSEENQVSTQRSIDKSPDSWNKSIWGLPCRFGSRELHWVTIEMLCVPVDEEIPEVSDSVVKAITGRLPNVGVLWMCY